MHRWTRHAADGSLRSLKYSFGVGTANTFAVRLDDGSWLAVSPCAGAPAEALEELAKDGPVSALLAPNAFHHMGQAAWRARFPEAKSYAPEGALARLAKQAKGVPFESMDALVAKLPSRVSCFVPDGMKAPDVIVRATSGADTAWFTGDLISNTTNEDVGFVPRMIFSLFGGGSGYRYNPVPSIVYLRDRAAWRQAMRAALEAAPPTAVVPAHGDVVSDDVARRTLALLA